MNSRERDPNAWSALRGKHILIAEDEPAVRGVLRRVLEMQGCAVHEAENGQMAAELARQAPVDLVMTDLWMPVMNGVELIEALSAMNCPAEVIVLSAHITCATTEKLHRLGVFRILKKPTEIAALLEVVQAGLRSDRRRRLAEEFADGLGSGAGDGPSLVLIADDDDEARGLLGTILTGAGYRVEEARDGEEAVERLDAISLHRRRLAAPLTTAHSNGALFRHACLSFSTSLPGRTTGGLSCNKRALRARLTLLERIREFIRSVRAAHSSGALFRHACLSFSTSLPGRTTGGLSCNKRALRARLTLLERIREVRTTNDLSRPSRSCLSPSRSTSNQLMCRLHHTYRREAA